MGQLLGWYTNDQGWLLLDLLSELFEIWEGFCPHPAALKDLSRFSPDERIVHHHDPEVVLALLKKWQETSANAQDGDLSSVRTD